MTTQGQYERNETEPFMLDFSEATREERIEPSEKPKDEYSTTTASKTVRGPDGELLFSFHQGREASRDSTNVYMCAKEVSL